MPGRMRLFALTNKRSKLLHVRLLHSTTGNEANIKWRFCSQTLCKAKPMALSSENVLWILPESLWNETRQSSYKHFLLQVKHIYLGADTNECQLFFCIRFIRNFLFVHELMMVAAVAETSTKCRLHPLLWPLFSLSGYSGLLNSCLIF